MKEKMGRLGHTLLRTKLPSLPGEVAGEAPSGGQHGKVLKEGTRKPCRPPPCDVAYLLYGLQAYLLTSAARQSLK